MKKILFWAIASVFALASCSEATDVINQADSGETTTVNIVAALNDATAAKAGSEQSGIANVDGNTYDLRYILEIRDAAGATVYFKETKLAETNVKTISFTADLIKGRNYKFVLWADFVKNDASGVGADYHYKTTDGLNAITLSTDANYTYTLNDESKDAFFASENKVISTSAIGITMKRPLAKIRLVATDYIGLDATEKAYVLANTTAKYHSTYANVYNNFNAVDGSVVATKLASNITTADRKVIPVANAAGNELTVFFDYVFAPYPVSTRLGFAVTPNINAESTIASVPFSDGKIVIERNKLTTVRTKLFSTKQIINVTIDDNFDNYITLPSQIYRGSASFTTIAEAMVEAVSGDVIKLMEGIFTEDVAIPAGVTLEGVGDATIIKGHMTAGAGATLKNFKSVYEGKSNAGTQTVEALLLTGAGITIDGVTFTTPSLSTDNLVFLNGSKNGVAIAGDATVKNFTLKNSTITAPYWKGLTLQTSDGVTITGNTFGNLSGTTGTTLNGINPFSIAPFDSNNITITGNTFIRSKTSDMHMIHIIPNESVTTANSSTWSQGLIDNIAQIKDGVVNTWKEGPFISSKLTRNVRVTNLFIGQAGTTVGDWHIIASY